VAVFVRSLDVVQTAGLQRHGPRFLARNAKIVVTRSVSAVSDLANDDTISRIVIRAEPQPDLTVAGDAEFVISTLGWQQVTARSSAISAGPIGGGFKAWGEILTARAIGIACAVS